MHSCLHSVAKRVRGVAFVSIAEKAFVSLCPTWAARTSIWYMRYSWYMSMKRTNVYADPEDLAIIKEAAKRRGISEAEIIRQGIHLAAMANRVWDEPLFSRTFEGAGRTPSKREVRDVVADAVLRESGTGSAA